MLLVTNQVSRLLFMSSVREVVDEVIDTENNAHRRFDRESKDLDIVETRNERSKCERVHKVYSLFRYEFQSLGRQGRR